MSTRRYLYYILGTYRKYNHGKFIAMCLKPR